MIETMPQSGAYVLGFRVDPADMLQQVATEIQNIHHIFSVEPIFGVNYAHEEKVRNYKPVYFNLHLLATSSITA